MIGVEAVQVALLLTGEGEGGHRGRQEGRGWHPWVMHPLLGRGDGAGAGPGTVQRSVAGDGYDDAVVLVADEGLVADERRLHANMG